MFFLPDTPRWYYARGRHEEGDIALSQLNDLPVDSDKVQQIRREIMLAIETELEADSSLNWKQFLTLGVIDKTELKIVRRIMICFWLPMIREWMGSSLMAYYSRMANFCCRLPCADSYRQCNSLWRRRTSITRLFALWNTQHDIRPRLLPTLLHH